ncbi:hypothetical protein CVT25_004154 [Psilocybe cyanescens]|uniref:Uncharacterized protein n=1 Tax=Psilocybe cyanescens TaxID=93625 RepID=A0A409XKW5_PSICY|nr:hypothetical protein CVT25_004154 [Psilocybe cyanescens]
MGASLPSYATTTPPHSQSLSADTPFNPNPNPNLNLNKNQDNSVVPGSNTGWDSVVLVVHLYGTFVAEWVMRMCVDVDLIRGDGLGDAANVPVAELTTETTTTNPPGEAPHTLELAHKIVHMVLVDPIPILLSDPTVVHKFLYREPGSVSPVLLGSVNGVGGARYIESSNGGVSIGTAGSMGVGGEHLEQDAHIDSQAIGGVGASNHTLWSRYYSSAVIWYCTSQDADVARTLYYVFFWAEVERFVGGVGLLFAHQLSKASPTDNSWLRVIVIFPGSGSAGI